MGRAGLLVLGLLLTGCAPRFDVASFGGGALPPNEPKSVTDVVHHPNTAALLTVHHWPWEKPAQAWFVNQDGKVTFSPLSRDDSSLLDSLGPINSTLGKIQPTLPIVP